MVRRRGLVAGFVAAVACVAAVNAIVLTGGDEGHVDGPVDCALVLGGGVRDDGSPTDILRDRLDEALDLYRTGRVRKLLVSGDHRTAAYDEPNAMRTFLEARGVPAEDIFMDHAGVDTYSSVWRARHVFGARRLVVVTQRFHLSRALWCARSLGMEAEGHAADRRRYRGLLWHELREVGSRTKAFVDIGRARVPRHAGTPIDLTGDGRTTAG
jgi:vancomycin permeability regulator SanA